MDFNEVIDRRKTSREWTDREVAYDTIKKILEAGMKAPSWDHYRNWQFIVLHERADKERTFAYAKAVALFGKQHGKARYTLRLGTDWSMAKNYGGGLLYDITRPFCGFAVSPFLCGPK